jgi:hypothetical protein
LEAKGASVFNAARLCGTGLAAFIATLNQKDFPQKKLIARVISPAEPIPTMRRRDFDNFTFDAQDVARRVVFHWPEARSSYTC